MIQPQENKRFIDPLIIERKVYNTLLKTQKTYKALHEQALKDLALARYETDKLKRQAAHIYHQLDFQKCSKHGDKHILAMCVYCVDDRMSKLTEQMEDLKEMATRTRVVHEDSTEEDE